ncbi:hypothetical protein OSB04_017026 [Centaurea solstitialis]|uniref:Uncharacterized protein n=1 Tax=Centaurea solstitialis TaxID=347529 RepID=A0AA38WLN7_9ASTR|nr:hypothetical protein OSB04_017026 [Centaurea solstitialis]
MTVSASLIELIRQSQEEAVKQENQRKERIKGQVDQLVADSRGLLTRYGRVWVPVSCEARQTLLDGAHKSKFSIHPGATKMYRDLRASYWWPGMKREVARYVEKCLTCLRVKAEHQRPHGKLQPLEIPEWKWEHVTMDFVTGLSATVRKHDAIWVVVDRLTKSAHFIAIREASSSEVLADIYVREIVARHGVPVTVISDRDVRFTSRFWNRFHEELGTTLQFSTAFHPQTDGQSERTIQTLEDMLRACVLEFGGSWDSHLPLVEFSYNNSFHASIGMPPYEMLYGRRCRTPVCWGEVGQRELGSTEIVQRTTESVQLIRDRLRTAQSRQKSYADKRRSDLEFRVGDRVLLKVSPWKGVIRFRKRGKLGPRFIGPFVVIARVGKVAYRLELPPELSQIHNTFHVSQLRKCLADESAHVPLEDIQVDERLSYIERPIAVLERKTKTLRNKEVGIVKVQWEHRKGSEWTWEPEDEMRRNHPEFFQITGEGEKDRFGREGGGPIEGLREAIDLVLSSIGVKALPEREKKRFEAPGSACSVSKGRDREDMTNTHVLLGYLGFNDIRLISVDYDLAQLRVPGLGVVKSMEEKKTIRPQQKPQALNCPRCNSSHTKFCYYNNYSLSQPRYFCKTCRRYWTEGGSLRNVPVGGGSRRNKRSSSSSSSSSNPTAASISKINQQHQMMMVPPVVVPSLITQNPNKTIIQNHGGQSQGQGQDLNLGYTNVSLQFGNNLPYNPNTTTTTSSSSHFSAMEFLKSSGFADPREVMMNSIPNNMIMNHNPPSGLNFSLDGFQNSGGYHHQNQHQQHLQGTMSTITTTGGTSENARILFPFEDLKPISTTNSEATRGQGESSSGGYWGGGLGGGSCPQIQSFLFGYGFYKNLHCETEVLAQSQVPIGTRMLEQELKFLKNMKFELEFLTTTFNFIMRSLESDELVFQEFKSGTP